MADWSHCSGQPDGAVRQLELLLRATRNLNDLQDCFVHLGYQAGDDAHPDVIARWKSFSVIGIVEPEPRHELPRNIRKSGRPPGTFLVAALTPDRTLTLAAPRLDGSGGIVTAVVSLTAEDAETARFVQQFSPGRCNHVLDLALRIDEKLHTQPVSNRFYQLFKSFHEQFVATLPERFPHHDRHLIALLPLLRVLFLYFIQEKGWLEQDSQFLRSRLDRALTAGRSFHEHVLNPLCFETLNQPQTHRTHARNIPYLNGGLFERHAVEHGRDITFANELWRDVFDGLYERFRFCTREGTDVGTVHPEMLGHVFERLMDGQDRHASGSFYTPQSIVDDLVSDSIGTALANRTSLDESIFINRAEIPPDTRHIIRAALQSITVLDPAAGTGAFLMGALEYLAGLRCQVTPHITPLHARKQVLQHSIFGVDQNPIAVRLCELRLWLSVVSDDPTTDPSLVEPLPNFDAVVVQGDSLLDPIAATHVLMGHRAHVPHTLVRTAAARRKSLFRLNGQQHRAALKETQTVERTLRKVFLTRAQRLTDQRLADLGAAATDCDLFGKRIGLTPVQRRLQSQLRFNRDAITRAAGADRDEQTPFFSYDIQHAGVMATGGFDVVLGNPPWVRSERIPPATRRALKHRYAWCSSTTQHKPGFRHDADLSVAFLERSRELCKPGGTVGLLLPSKLATAAYGSAARQALVCESTIRYVKKIHEGRARAFGATTYPMSIVFDTVPPAPEHTVNTRSDDGRSGTLRQDSLGAGPWILAPDRTRSALADLTSAGVPLSRLGEPALGAKTGANDVFLIPPGHVLSKHARPAVRGRDIGRFRARSSCNLVWPCDQEGKALTRLPADLHKHFHPHSDRLRARSDWKSGPAWQLFRTGAALAPHRVAWADIAREPRAVFLDAIDERFLPLNTCYVCPVPDAHYGHVVTTVLNSVWTTVWSRAVSDPARGGYRRFNAHVMRNVRVPDPTIDLVTLSTDAHTHATFDQDTLDDAVADALDLSAATRSALRSAAPR